MKAGWQTTTLGEAFSTVTGNTPPKNNPLFYGQFMPLVKPPELCDATLDSAEDGLSEVGAGVSRTAPPNSILVSCIGNLGKVGLNTIPVAFNQQINAILPDIKKAIPEFMFYQALSNSFRDQLESLSSGTTVPIVNKSKFNSIQIVLPTILEQQRIVAILDQAFDGIATAKAYAEKNLQNARALFQTGYHTIFDEPLMEGYRRITVADVAHPSKGSMRTGPFGSQLLHSEFVDNGISVLGIDNAVNNKFRWDKRRYITEEKFKELSRYRVKPGDVLITIMGTCGRCAIVPDDIPTAINTKHLCCITLDTSKCLPGFLHGYFLHHPVAQQFLASKAKGSIMAGLNMAIISELPILLPSLKQQQYVVKKVDSLREETQHLASLYQRKVAALDELKKSLLHQAFSGAL